MATVVPPKGEEETWANNLLFHADDVNHVQVTMDGPTGLMFIVPDYLADRFTESERAKHADDADESTSDEAEEVTDESAPAPKRRGRQPGSKNKPKTDSTD